MDAHWQSGGPAQNRYYRNKQPVRGGSGKQVPHSDTLALRLHAAVALDAVRLENLGNIVRKVDLRGPFA